ncbi:MAG: polyprenyl synthetase family protein [Anaerolineaceae bacterium]|nr:polyprenyl synthetase family protein [Anaerolineaceae bacterium]
MNNLEWDPLLHEYSDPVIHKIRSTELSSTFSDYNQLLEHRIQNMPAWQIALPVIACQAAGGSAEDGILLASAWVSLFLASEVLDNVEDRELMQDRILSSPQVATNLATSLIFTAFHTLTSVQDAGTASQIVGIFSGYGFDAAHGQHRDLMQNCLPVEEYLHNYWEIVILKSGSVFRAATEAGAAAGRSDGIIADALADYGTALGVILQLLDDCRDAFNHSQEAIHWEVTLPLLLYLMMVGEENIVFPQVSSQAEWSDLLQKTGVIDALSSLLIQWKSRALDSLGPLGRSREVTILEKIPSLLLEQIPSVPNEVIDEHDVKTELS